jgi:hypothetical protein
MKLSGGTGCQGKHVWCRPWGEGWSMPSTVFTRIRAVTMSRQVITPCSLALTALRQVPTQRKRPSADKQKQRPASPPTCDSFTSHPSCSSRRSRNLAPRKLSSWRDGSADTVLQGGKEREHGASVSARACLQVYTSCHHGNLSASAGLQGLTAHATLQQRPRAPRGMPDNLQT